MLTLNVTTNKIEEALNGLLKLVVDRRPVAVATYGHGGTDQRSDGDMQEVRPRVGRQDAEAASPLPQLLDEAMGESGAAEGGVASARLGSETS